MKRLFIIIRAWIKGLFFGRKTYSMAIVRRYTDANGSYVGELYLLGSFCGVMQYSQIGMSLDTLPFETHQVTSFDLDVENDFLKPMPSGCVRVGAQDPRDTETVRKHVGRLAGEGAIMLQVQNKFIEHVMGKSGKGDTGC